MYLPVCFQAEESPPVTGREEFNPKRSAADESDEVTFSGFTVSTENLSKRKRPTSYFQMGGAYFGTNSARFGVERTDSIITSAERQASLKIPLESTVSAKMSSSKTLNSEQTDSSRAVSDTNSNKDKSVGSNSNSAKQKGPQVGYIMVYKNSLC